MVPQSKFNEFVIFFLKSVLQDGIWKQYNHFWSMEEVWYQNGYEGGPIST